LDPPKNEATLHHSQLVTNGTGMEALHVHDGYLEIESMETNNDGPRQKVTRLTYLSVLVSKLLNVKGKM